MSYQVLARKWRPATFEQVVGQSHVLQALTNALSQQRLHHAYLFTGTRGVGKTSLARLFAKGLNCEQGVTATPCGKCASCIEIAEGRFVDLIEVDAASRTKVDDTRELLDNVQYRPTRGRYKVYLIDEVHMLSRSSFNALLKTLEEPPEHVKFLLATTDPQKLPITVLSRCLQFNLKSLTQDDIDQQLAKVLSAEQVPFESQALNLLAKAANGSMRDALSLTDQAIAFGAGQVLTQQVQSMLGSIDEHQVLVLLHALINGDIAQLMQTNADVLSFGADADEVLRSLLELLHQVTLTQFAPAAAQLSLYAEQIKALAKQLEPEQVQLYYQLLLTGRKDLPYAPDPKSGLEMALLRAVAFVPDSEIKQWQVEQPLQLDEVIEVKPKLDIQPQIDIEAATSVVTPVVTATTLAAEPEPEPEPEPVAAEPEIETATQQPTASMIADNHFDYDSDNDDMDAALAAEQDMIYSQAYNQGFHHDEPPIEADYHATPINEPVHTEAIETSHVAVETVAVEEEDDLLDAVLNARQELLGDVSELEKEAEDNSAKKSTADSVFKHKPRVASAPESVAAPVVETATVTTEVEDRPPWEEQPEPVATSAQVEKIATVAIPSETKLAPSLSTHQDNASSVNTRITDTMHLPAVADSISGDEVDLHWYKLMSALHIGGRVRQLAVNSVCLQLDEPLPLKLKPDQKHLAAAGAIEQLAEAISQAMGKAVSLTIDVGVVAGRETPLEIRQRFHRELLQGAHVSLMNDSNVQWFMQQMGATLMDDTLAYPQELLALRSQEIKALVEIPN